MSVNQATQLKKEKLKETIQTIHRRLTPRVEQNASAQGIEGMRDDLFYTYVDAKSAFDHRDKPKKDNVIEGMAALERFADFALENGASEEGVQDDFNLIRKTLDFARDYLAG